jgi:hypothetical protein
MTTMSTFPPRRPGAPARPAASTLARRRSSPQSEVTRLAEAVRMEAAALDAGHRLRSTGRLSLPIKTLRR